MEPVSGNNSTKRCGESISSNCVHSDVPAIPCLSICNGASSTDVMYQTGITLCTMLSEMTSLETLVNPLLNFSSIDLGCLYSPTITVWTCPAGQVFVPDSGAPPGYCGVLGPSGFGTFVPGVGWVAAATSSVPVATTLSNPTPKPTTLAGILQLIINHIPCCDPCSKSVNPGP